jgi:hypothetical protein
MEVLEELGHGVADLLVEFVVGQRLDMSDSLRIEYHPWVLVHVAHLLPFPEFLNL